MKKEGLGKKILVGIGVMLAAIAVTAVGTKIGNSGLDATLKEWKEQVKDKFDDPSDSTSTSATARLSNGDVVTIEF